MLRHWEIHESTKETQVEIILQRAREQFPQARREEKLATARAAQKGPAIRRTLR